MDDAIYGGFRKRDSVTQGRTLLWALAIFFYLAWILEFLTAPVYLVPGFYFDGSGSTLISLVALLVEFAVFSLSLLLLLCGLRWASFLLAPFLALAGIFNLVGSMKVGAFGGPALFMALAEFVICGALFLSHSLTAFLGDRKERGIPWFSVGLTGVGLFTGVLVVMAIPAWQTYQVSQVDVQETAFASKIIRSFCDTLDINTLNQVASDGLKGNMDPDSFPAVQTELQKRLGSLVDFEPPQPRSIGVLVMDPQVTGRVVYQGRGHYQKGFLTVTLSIDFDHQPWVLQAFEYAPSAPQNDEEPPAIRSARKGHPNGIRTRATSVKGR